MSFFDFIAGILFVFVLIAVGGICLIIVLFKKARPFAAKARDVFVEQAQRGTDGAIRKVNQLKDVRGIPEELRKLVSEARRVGRQIAFDKKSCGPDQKVHLAGVFTQVEELLVKVNEFEGYLGKLYRVPRIETQIAHLATEISNLESEAATTGESTLRKRLHSDLLETKTRQLAGLHLLQRNRDDSRLAVENLHGLLLSTSGELAMLTAKEALDGQAVQQLKHKLTAGSESLVKTLDDIQKFDPEAVDYSDVPSDPEQEREAFRQMAEADHDRWKDV